MRKSDCRFCNIIHEHEAPFGEVDIPFLYNKDYSSLISIGSFIDGWSLIVPTEHSYNMRLHYQKDMFFFYLQQHMDVLKNQQYLDGADYIAFEHGANRCGSLTSCGTNHAHLHVIPTKIDIIDSIQKDRVWNTCKWTDVADKVKDHEYLLYCNEPQEKESARILFHIVEQPESQYFRRKLNEALCDSGNYDYKEEPRLDYSVDIRRRIGDAICLL